MKNNLPGSPSLTVLKIAAFIIIIAAMIQAKSILNPFFIALFISIICAQPIYWLEKKKVPRGLSIIIVVIGILAIFFGFGYLIGGQVASFTANKPKFETSLKEISDSFIQFLNSHGIKITHSQFWKLIEPSSILKFTATAVNEVVKVLSNSFLIMLTILFMLLELKSFPDKMRIVFKGKSVFTTYFQKIIDSLRQYLAIKTVICIVIGILTYVVLAIIGLDNALLWGFIAGLLYYIPYIGSLIAIIPPILQALVQFGIGGALWTLLSILVTHNIIANFFEPKIMGKGLGLSTLVVFMSLIFWGFIFGIVGMFISVPLTITLKLIFEQNEKTKWIAIMLGTPKDARIHLENRDKENLNDKDKAP